MTHIGAKMDHPAVCEGGYWPGSGGSSWSPWA